MGQPFYELKNRSMRKMVYLLHMLLLLLLNIQVTELSFSKLLLWHFYQQRLHFFKEIYSEHWYFEIEILFDPRDEK